MPELCVSPCYIPDRAAPPFPQKPAAPIFTNGASQKDEQQVRQLAAEMLKGEMNNDPAVVERIDGDDCVLLPGGPDCSKARLVVVIHDSHGQAPAYIASQEDMHVYMLGDTATAMYVKTYVVSVNP